MEDAIAFQDLPEGHLFRILHSEGPSMHSSFFAPPPIFWDEILARLSTEEGKQEVRQWVMASSEKPTLFLHELLNIDYGEPQEERESCWERYFGASSEDEGFGTDEDDGFGVVEEDDDDNSDAETGTTVATEDEEQEEQDHSGADEVREGQGDETGEDRGSNNEEIGGGNAAGGTLDSMSMPLKVIMATIMLYPKALRLATVDGYLPLHLVCRSCEFDAMISRPPFIPWRPISNEVLDILLRLYPGAAKKIPLNDHNSALNGLCGMSLEYANTTRAITSLLRLYPKAASIPNDNEMYPLHTLLAMHFLTRKKPTMHLVQLLLDAYPQVVKCRDDRGYLPLHYACENSQEHSIVKLLVSQCIQTTMCRSKGDGQTPILLSIRNCGSADNFQITKLLLEACPCSAFIGDDNDTIKTNSYRVDAVGDALDYICVEYCNVVGVLWCGMDIFDDEGEYIGRNQRYEDDTENYRRYYQANLEYLDGKRFDHEYDQDYINAVYAMFLDILRVMYGRATYLPLHAMCQGLTCRPWNIAVLQETLQRFGEQAHEKDNNGNLPLHLFMESCQLAKTKAIERRYVLDAFDYQDAVENTGKLILNENPSAALTLNGDGVLPIHLAIENHCLPDEVILDSFVTPLTLRARYVKTRLYPFANAALGPSANLGLSYTLLRKDPSVLKGLVTR